MTDGRIHKQTHIQTFQLIEGLAQRANSLKNEARKLIFTCYQRLQKCWNKPEEGVFATGLLRLVKL